MSEIIAWFISLLNDAFGYRQEDLETLIQRIDTYKCYDVFLSHNSHLRLLSEQEDITELNLAIEMFLNTDINSFRFKSEIYIKETKEIKLTDWFTKDGCYIDVEKQMKRFKINATTLLERVKQLKEEDEYYHYKIRITKPLIRTIEDVTCYLTSVQEY